jgi:hypothetical protein
MRARLKTSSSNLSFALVTIRIASWLASHGSFVASVFAAAPRPSANSITLFVTGGMPVISASITI